MTLTSTEKRHDEIESVRSKGTQFTIEIAGAAMFGALSLIVSALLTPYALRIPIWGITIFEAIGVIWIACFYIFGPRAGFLSLVIGAFTLLPFDTNQWGWIGPVMKFGATLPLILVPVLLLRLYKSDRGSEKLKNPINFLIVSAVSVVARIIIMILLNYVVLIIVFTAYDDPFLNGITFINLAYLGLPAISGWDAIILGCIVINLYQSVFELGVAYVLVFGLMDYGLGLDEKFPIWNGRDSI